MHQPWFFVRLITFSVLYILAHGYTQTLYARSITVQGLQQAQHFYPRSNGPYYIQAGSFRSLRNAEIYKSRLATQLHQPLSIKQHDRYFRVVLGPYYQASAVRAVGQQHPLTPRPQYGTYHAKPPVVAQPVILSTKTTPRPVLIPPKDVAPRHIELIGAVGFTGFYTHHTPTRFAADELDMLVSNNGDLWESATGQLGVGYVYPLDWARNQQREIKLLPYIEPQINAYYAGANGYTGHVWRFNNPSLSELHFDAPLHTGRVMFDGAIGLAAYRNLSAFAIAGLGNSWNELDYYDSYSPNTSTVTRLKETINLHSATTAHFAWEVGGGITYAYQERIGLSLEYLYANLGTATTTATGTTGAITNPSIVPPVFDVWTQAVILGLHLTL